MASEKHEESNRLSVFSGSEPAQYAKWKKEGAAYVAELTQHVCEGEAGTKVV